jgi:RND family efflux transporter MFP subunit
VIEPVVAPLDGDLTAAEAVNCATVSAQTSGRVAEILRRERLRARRRGHPRLRTGAGGLAQAEAGLREATAREAEAQTRYTRIADMYERRVVPKATLDEATANRDAAVARLVAARAAVTTAREGVTYTEIRAPYAGVVTKRHVEVGESVGPGTPLMSGLSLQYLRVSVEVPQSIVKQVRLIRKAAVYVDDKRIEATKLTVFPVATSPANTLRARVDLPENAADLYPGMFVKVGFTIGETAGCSCLLLRWSSSSEGRLHRRRGRAHVVAPDPDGSPHRRSH